MIFDSIILFLAIALTVSLTTSLDDNDEDDEDEWFPIGAINQCPKNCQGCQYLYGQMIDQELFVCSLHPKGLDDCPDRQLFPVLKADLAQGLFENQKSSIKWENNIDDPLTLTFKVSLCDLFPDRQSRFFDKYYYSSLVIKYYLTEEDEEIKVRLCLSGGKEMSWSYDCDQMLKVSLPDFKHHVQEAYLLHKLSQQYQKELTEKFSKTTIKFGLENTFFGRYYPFKTNYLTGYVCFGQEQFQQGESLQQEFTENKIDYSKRENSRSEDLQSQYTLFFKITFSQLKQKFKVND